MVYGSYPPAGPVLIFLSANRNLENSRPGIEILGVGPHAEIPSGTRKVLRASGLFFFKVLSDCGGGRGGESIGA